MCEFMYRASTLLDTNMKNSTYSLKFAPSDVILFAKITCVNFRLRLESEEQKKKTKGKEHY